MIVLSEVSQTEKDKHHLYVKSEKSEKSTSEFTYKTERDS